MTKLTNYLATVTDVNSVFPANGAVVPNSERCVIKDETGQTAGSVGALNHWQIDPTADPLVTYTNPRLPRWQDLVPLTKYTYARYDTSGCSSFNPINVYSYVYYPNGYYYLDGGTTLYYLANYTHEDYTIYVTSASSGTCIPLLNCSFIDILSNNALDSYYAFRLYQSTVGVASYNNYIIISPTNTARHILSNQTSATTSYMIAGFATSTSPGGGTAFFRYAVNIYKLKQDYPSITTFTFDLYGARLYETLQQFTIRNSIKTGFLEDLAPPANGVDFKSSIAESVFSDYITTMCQPLNTYVKIGYFTLNTLANTFVYTNIQGSSCTTTTTSTTSTSTSTTTTTTTCNPTANWQWNGGYNCYSTCNTYQVEQDINPCSLTYGQTRQGSLYQTNTTICGGCCGQSTVADWQNTGIYNCYGTCNLYYEQKDMNPCSLTYEQTRQGPLYQTNSISCGGCCGQSTAANWVNNGAQFCSGCTLYQPERDSNACSPTYNQTRNTSLGISNNCGSWNISYYCQGCAYYSKETNSCTGDVRNVTLISSNSDTCGSWNISYYCSGCGYYSKETNSCTGNIRNVTLINGNSTNCGGCCGQSTAANWVNSGSYNCYGTCNKYNIEVDNNSCSPTYNQTRQGSLVESNSTFCGGCCGVSPSANWVNNGSTFCSGCVLYQPQIDNNVCSSTYGNTRNVDLGVNTSCGSWNTSYYCVGCAYYSKETNSCTGDIRNITLISSDSTSCGGCCGQSTSPSWTNEGSAYCDNCVSKQLQRDTNPCSATYNQTRVINSGTACNYTANWVNSGSYDCYGSCTKYNVEVDNNPCSSTYNQTRQGSVVEYNSTFCGGCCGQSTGPNWVDNGSTFCDGCNLQQPQIDNNPCSATYGQTRNVDLGVSTACGTWVQSFYCVGYTKWTKETNSCTGNIRNESVVEYDSPYCGYVPPPACRTYQIVGDYTDESVNGIYTNCSGGGDSFSFFGGPGTVGYICAQAGSVYVTSGNGYASDVGGC